VTDSFDRLEWEHSAKGQRSAPSSHYRPSGRYVLVKDFGIPNLPGFLPKGSSVYLTAEQATRMTEYLKPGEGG
jgi:hypothetical protein